MKLKQYQSHVTPLTMDTLYCIIFYISLCTWNKLNVEENIPALRVVMCRILLLQIWHNNSFPIWAAQYTGNLVKPSVSLYIITHAGFTDDFMGWFEQNPGVTLKLQFKLFLWNCTILTSLSDTYFIIIVFPHQEVWVNSYKRHKCFTA